MAAQRRDELVSSHKTFFGAIDQPTRRQQNLFTQKQCWRLRTFTFLPVHRDDGDSGN